MAQKNSVRQQAKSLWADAYLAHIPEHPQSAAEALVALDTVTERFRQMRDPRAAFPDVYAIITRKVATEVQKRDCAFLEPRWISRLAGRFCERYLETLRFSLEDNEQDTVAWRCAYESAERAGTPPIQNALLGLSAHINDDLIVGIYDNIVEFGHQNDPEMLARYKHDHDYVNEILFDSVIEALDVLVTRHGCMGSAFLRSWAFLPTIKLTMALLRTWRAHVWNEVLALLAADEKKRTAIMRRVHRRSGRIGAFISLPNRLFLPLKPFPTPLFALQTASPPRPHGRSDASEAYATRAAA